MSIIKFTRNILYQIGILHVVQGSDKSYGTAREIRLLVEFGHDEPVAQNIRSFYSRTRPSKRQAESCLTCNICASLCFILCSYNIQPAALEPLTTEVSRTFISALRVWISLAISKPQPQSKTYNCVVVWVQVKFTVKSLHAGTLVTCWTTAPSIPFLQNRLAQLASTLLLFFVLTIATRCYSTTNAAKLRLDQSQPLPNLSPIRNSKIHSSSIVLSRIIQTHFVQKKNSHSPDVFLHLIDRRKRELSKGNSNRISEKDFIPKKKKRVHLRVEEVESKGYLNKIRGKTAREPSVSNSRTEVLTQRRNGENFSDVVSDTGNFSRVISQKLNNSSFEVGSPDKRLSLEKDERPMPPVYGHSDNSCELELYDLWICSIAGRP